MIKFEKVSFEQFYKDIMSSTYDITDKEIQDIYNNIKLPKRATKCSAGYDFYAPYDLTISEGAIDKIPTGIRCQMDEDVVLLLVPRSSLGFKYRLALDNTLGVIDADYYNAKNEGHIQCKMHMPYYDLKIKQGEAYMQGIFVRYLKTDDDNTTEVRSGGIGSTNKKE